MSVRARACIEVLFGGVFFVCFWLFAFCLFVGFLLVVLFFWGLVVVVFGGRSLF